MSFFITIFTPTYNRGYIIEKLYKSLQAQTCMNFEWIIIDDGSTDNTEYIINQWLKDENKFKIRFFKTENRGKQRAINTAVNLASYDYFFCVDSDDKLTPDAIENVITWLPDIHKKDEFAGVSGLRRILNRHYSKPFFEKVEYIDCTNIERYKYNIDCDCAEIYKTNILKKYPFKVWEGETFTPECIVWDAIAIDGYKLRWYNSYIYECEYLDDGLTNGGYNLYSKNLMGCAMANNIKIETANSYKRILFLILEICISCILSNNISYLRQTKFPIIAYLLLPISIPFALRRKSIIKKFCNRK